MNTTNSFSLFLFYLHPCIHSFSCPISAFHSFFSYVLFYLFNGYLLTFSLINIYFPYLVPFSVDGFLSLPFLLGIKHQSLTAISEFTQNPCFTNNVKCSFLLSLHSHFVCLFYTSFSPFMDNMFLSFSCFPSPFFPTIAFSLLFFFVSSSIYVFFCHLSS